METIQTKIDSLLQGTANSGSVGDLTLKELVLSNPPKISSLRQRNDNPLACTVWRTDPARQRWTPRCNSGRRPTFII
jgi:hypothetical protein